MKSMSIYNYALFALPIRRMRASRKKPNFATFVTIRTQKNFGAKGPNPGGAFRAFEDSRASFLGARDAPLGAMNHPGFVGGSKP